MEDFGEEWRIHLDWRTKSNLGNTILNHLNNIDDLQPIFSLVRRLGDLDVNAILFLVTVTLSLVKLVSQPQIQI